MKKVLSFVLSVAMVICLMPSLAFAADDTATGLSQFSDADSINKKEAVAVLVGLGIVDGMGDGTFQPAGNLTRAQASKLVATLVKSGDKSEIPAPAADPFTDVAKSYWGAGAIKFGVDNGYINGMGDGTFHPEDEVTTAQLATMLDKLLGYSVADINYQWPENAMAKATISGLLKGVVKNANDALNREEAAQMIFNALEANTKVKSTTTGSDTSLVDGGSDYANVPNKLADDYRNPAVDATEQLIEKYFPKATFDKENSKDDFGRTSSVWKVGKNKVTDEIVATPEYTYTSLQTKSSLKADLDGYDLSSVLVVKNGVPSTKVQTVIDEDGKVVKDENGKDKTEEVQAPKKLKIEDISKMTGNGNLVEVYLNDKGSAVEKIIVINYVPAEVISVNSQDESLRINTKENIIPGDLDPSPALTSYDITKEDDADIFAKVASASTKDIILVAVGKDSNKKGVVLDAYIPDYESGKLTKITDPKYKNDDPTDEKLAESEYVLGGETYKAATVRSSIEFTSDHLKKTEAVYLDEYGYIKANGKVETVKDDYILVKGTYDKKNKFGQPTWYVIGVNEDGEVVEDLKISKDSPKDQSTLKVDELIQYKETGNGYEFGKDEDNVDGKDKSYFVNQATGPIKSNAPTVVDTAGNKYYISGDVKAITVTAKDNDLEELKATTKEGTPVVAEDIQVRYVVVDNEVTSIFVLKNRVVSDEIIYLSGKKDYTEVFNIDEGGTGTATAVEGYKAASPEPEYILIYGNTGQGFYSDLEEYGKADDGTVVYKAKPYNWTANDDVKTVSGKVTVAASNGIVTVNGVEYRIKNDDAVRDLTTNQKDTGVAKISSIEALIDAVKEEDVNDNTMYEISVAMAYEKDTNANVNEATQVYVTEVKVIGSRVKGNEIPTSESLGGN